MNEERRIFEEEMAAREEAIEKRMQQRINIQNERFAHDDDVRRSRTDELIREAVRNEKQRLEAENAELRNMLESRHAEELQELRNIVEQSRMQKMEAERLVQSGEHRIR